MSLIIFFYLIIGFSENNENKVSIYQIEKKVLNFQCHQISLKSLKKLNFSYLFIA